MLGRGGSRGQFQGRSLLGALAGDEDGARRAVLSRTVWDRPRYSRRDEQYKFIYDTRTGEEELYDLASDPGERTNLASRDPLRAAWARESLHHWIVYSHWQRSIGFCQARSFRSAKTARA